ncbi:ABC transporter ATP-binding protein [Conexibacter woesei]|uniref:ABC transporter related protein n=1 Tax=Conexibacter woesei (strain DSM 14684 / CCUG 47730 / CIP 108061 / JCM 11494 / NBRC 100937 / ID131577) TaxID=469383 RepID=D3F6N0_CONWI|nr:ABC transporter ATP-binding protein [Conexibacter woesei]ADB50797.1 ABC transporter related protein [Conexibacter woesei DSM 14684]
MIRHLFQLCPQPRLLIRLSALHAVLAVLQGLLLALLIPILDAVLRPQPDFAAATPWLIAGGAGLVVYAALTAIATPVGFAASMDLAAQLRHRAIDHATTLPLGWFTAEHKTRLARTVTADASNIGQLAVTIGAPAIISTLVPATIVVVTFAVDWRMALLFLALAPIAFLTLRRAARIAAIADAELDAAATEIAGRAIELGQAQPVLRAAGHGTTGSARMRAALDEHRASYRRGLRRSLVPDLTYTAVVMAGFVAVLALGAHLMLSGELEVAEAVALLVLAVRFLEPLGGLIELIGALRAMDNAIVRVRALLDTPALPVRAQPVHELADAAIELSGVTYAYGDRPALSDVSFRCEPGTTTALVGPSGSGKTTVTRLIARFFDVGQGSVRIGGVDVRDVDPAVLLEDVAIVFQDVYLFDDTIEENLRLARPDASWEELEQAARAARLDEVVERLPDGWRTRVGEAGAQLSGGERQRVSIARAFLKRARIVLIDEAGSALDPENEAAVSEAIANLTRDRRRTVIVIAHRPATLAAADRVAALDRGRVTETGTPADLRRSGGTFARLYDQYDHARSWRITAR